MAQNANEFNRAEPMGSVRTNAAELQPFQWDMSAAARQGLLLTRKARAPTSTSVLLGWIGAMKTQNVSTNRDTTRARATLDTTGFLH